MKNLNSTTATNEANRAEIILVAIIKKLGGGVGLGSIFFERNPDFFREIPKGEI